VRPVRKSRGTPQRALRSDFAWKKGLSCSGRSPLLVRAQMLHRALNTGRQGVGEFVGLALNVWSEGGAGSCKYPLRSLHAIARLQEKN